MYLEKNAHDTLGCFKSIICLEHGTVKVLLEQFIFLQRSWNASTMTFFGISSF